MRVAMRPGNGPERREDERHSVDLPVVLRPYRQPPVKARMADVSATGTMLSIGDHPLLRGDEVIAVVLGFELVATIAWLSDGFAGLTFHRRLEPIELAAIRRMGRVGGHA